MGCGAGVAVVRAAAAEVATRVTTRVITTCGSVRAERMGKPTSTAPTPPMMAHQQHSAMAATIKTISKVRF